MIGYEPHVTVDPTNKYEKARKDVIQARNSVQELTPQQQEQLFKEMFGAEAIEYIQRMTQRKF